MAKPRGRPFTGAEDPRNGPAITEQLGATNSRAKEPVSRYFPLPDDGAPAALVDMRHVWLNGKAHDATEAHRNARAFKDKDPKGFLQLMTEMESAYKKEKRQEAAAGAGAEVVDVGTDKAIALAVEFLKECRKKVEGG
jgi:hypothetical protein